MKLRKPCPHGKYDEHPWDDFGEVSVFTCPGGEFLSEGALVILRWCETHDAEMVLKDACWKRMDPWGMGLTIGERSEGPRLCVVGQRQVLDALASQVGESE